MVRTKIVCTIGPVSRSSEMLRALISAGMDMARLNFSHGNQEHHGENIALIRAAAEKAGKPTAILADLQGPKLRIGVVPQEGIYLEEGQEVVLTTQPIFTVGVIPVQYEDLPRYVGKGDRILIDDGLIELGVLNASGSDIHCRVLVGGVLFSNKGLNLPRAPIAIPAITAKDKEDLFFALDGQVDWVAMSFVRTASEVRALKDLIDRRVGIGLSVPVIAKVEKPEAVENIDEIIEAADGIMIARGDLGIETSPEEVPLIQKRIIAKCNRAGKPAITATQMLDSMIRNPRPTRAEANDVANAILDGSDAIMLSGETAIGKYPLESVKTMVRIAEYTENSAESAAGRDALGREGQREIAEAVARAACEMARDLKAAAIITPTVSGLTPRLVSKFRPDTPIIAVTPSLMVQRRLSLLWGVYTLLAERSRSTDEMISVAVQSAAAHGYVQAGELVVVTAGAASDELTPTPTDLIKVQRVEPKPV